MIGKSADVLAFARTPDEYRCAAIVEVPDEFDWATAMARKFFCDHFNRLRLGRLSDSPHKLLADLSRRIEAEEQLHVEHVDRWMQRLGRGTDESHARMQTALDGLSPLAPMLFEMVEGQQALADAGIYPGCGPTMFDEWRQQLQRIAAASTLRLPDLPTPPADARGGRHGIHTPHLKELLNEMCEVYRMEPGAAW
jgi:ring-1,2-phenylacetyl-CoA epoxidase subunit PaaC